MTNPIKYRGAEKVARIPVKVEPVTVPLEKPEWIRGKVQNSDSVVSLKKLLRNHRLHTVCEEAACPNLGECFQQGTATFMILGDVCTRRCPFCDVAHGRPSPADALEPAHLAEAVFLMGLHYVVITSVNRDDLRDGGAEHFASCIRAIRRKVTNIRVEVLVPDFRGRADKALSALATDPPDVFNHNIETVPRLYRSVRPGADYRCSLALLKQFRSQHPTTPTKSGLMLGLGETTEEVEAVMADLRVQGCDILTLGQYLRPSPAHLPVRRYVTPDEFKRFADVGRSLGFRHVESGPLVRSSYHADTQVAAMR
jgi:lipoic acid synthetase